MALGAGETSLKEFTTAYASFVNGRKKGQVLEIEFKIRRGKNIYLENFTIWKL